MEMGKPMVKVRVSLSTRAIFLGVPSWSGGSLVNEWFRGKAIFLGGRGATPCQPQRLSQAGRCGGSDSPI